MNPFLSGIEAVLWLVLLWNAAPVLRGRTHDPVTRVRNALLLGIAIPFALGLVHALYGPACWLAVLVLCYVARRRLTRLAADGSSDSETNLWLFLPVVVVCVVAMPSLLEPQIEGDTLIYHLPNAAAWAQSGTLWTTGTRYWWFPGGSELFAAGLLSVGGWWAVGLSGAVAAALLGLRLAAWSVAIGAPRWAGALIASAFVATPVVAAQTGDLRNDVWLAALFVESLWSLRQRDGEVPALAATAVTKPIGPIFALICAIVGRARLGYVAAGIPLLLWLARDAILWRSADVPPASTLYPVWGTMILAHGWIGIGVLGSALWQAGLATFAWCVLPLVGLFVPSVRAQAAAGMLASGVFLLYPFGFENNLPQLATGESLRYDMPGMATGALVAAALAARAPLVLSTLAGAAFLVGMRAWLSIFWNDPITHRSPLIVCALAIGVALAPSRARRLAISAACAVLVVFASLESSSRAAPFYDAHMPAASGAPTRLYEWLQSFPPRSVVLENARAGSLAMTSPRTAVGDAAGPNACDEARRRGALLIVGSSDVQPAPLDQTRFARARACGRVLYGDAAALVIEPRWTRLLR